MWNLDGIDVEKIVCLTVMAGLWMWGCSGDVDVHGIPKTIELEAPFCAPAKDAGAE